MIEHLLSERRTQGAANIKIKVWVNDEHAAIIAPNEQVHLETGMITNPR